MEIWKIIPEHPAYEASDAGRIRKSYAENNYPAQYVLTPKDNGRGYLRVVIKLSLNKYKSIMVHALVALAFIGPRPEKLVVNHKDCNKQNNVPSNLEYVTIAQNNKHAYSMGRNKSRHGEDNSFFGRRHSKWAKEQIFKARNGKPRGASDPQQKAENRKRWRALNAEKENERNRRKSLSLRGIHDFHSIEEWNNLKQERNFSCASCNQTEPSVKLIRDHVLPISRGGSDNIENIQPLCEFCNSSKHDATIRY